VIKHRYIKSIRKLGLFKDVKSFEEIEKQIEKHSDSNKDRGDAFEVFAEAYLTLGINLPYKAVYPENKLTAKHFNRLKITTSETNVRGIDGALETQSDEFHTYQVKYRSSGDSLSWNDLTGSVVASQNADALLIFTNVSDIDGDIAQRNVYSIRNDKLSDLTKDDLKRIEILIYKDQVKKKRTIKLDPYQKDAISDVLKKLKADDRTQLIMPCGSGKTIVGQRIIESIDDAKTILVLVPTLQLLNDTFENYFNDTRWDSFPFMCVGSKVVDSRAYDQMDADPSELPMVTRTDTESVKAFLKKKFNRHIIFSTYQSLPVVADALGKRKVDVAIFDEAHNTASKKGNVWTFGLDNKNIKIKKRIFMTATPRKYQLRRKNEEDMRVVFSMDDSKVYGDIAYKLSFKKAADEYGAICRYKIIISVITSKYYTRKDLRDGDVLVGYSDVNAENIAKQIALQDAVKNNTINKIISFHPTIAHSENFVGEKEISVKHRLKDFDLYNVSSKKKMGIRRSTMSAFRKADTALISNAQCLNEGVDVPAVDMVAFMSPKRSKVSIVQAVGRAIRKPRDSDKEWGYVFVPIFLEKASGETDIEAAERSNFKDMYEVINALRDHDEVLDEVIKNLRIQKGNKGKFNGKIFDDYIQIIGVDITIKNLEKHIQSEVIDRMSSNWYEMYGLLKKYVADKKHPNPITDEVYDGKNLGNWVNTVRYLYKNEQSDPELKKRKILLESISNWCWNYNQKNWNLFFKALEDVGLDIFSNPNKEIFIKDLRNNKRSINKWLQIQRNISYPNLANEKKVKFESLKNWSWNPREYKRVILLQCLLDEINKRQSSLIESSFERDGIKIGEFLQAIKIGQKVLTEDEKNLLEKNKYWSSKSNVDLKWETAFTQLKEYYFKYGHTRLDKSYYKSYLFNWCSIQRRYFKENNPNLNRWKIKLLNSIEFIWDLDEYIWYENYTKAEGFYNDGELTIPHYTENNLYNWVFNQRQFLQGKKENQLDQKKISLLEKIGITRWSIYDQRWNDQYHELVEFSRINGHINVKEKENPKLYSWILVQRERIKGKSNRSRIKPYQMNLLKDINFK